MNTNINGAIITEDITVVLSELQEDENGEIETICRQLDEVSRLIRCERVNLSIDDKKTLTILDFIDYARRSIDQLRAPKMKPAN